MEIHLKILKYDFVSIKLPLNLILGSSPGH
jgi:hypothetical protein